MSHTPAASTNASPLDAALSYADSHRDDFLSELQDLLRIPSISTLSKHKKDIKRAAKFVANTLDDLGLDKVKVIKTPGHPLVYGEWVGAPGKPTVLIYGHYDVQPTDSETPWDQPDPFEPVIRGDNLYARGAVDDKGQMYAALMALRSLVRSNGAFPLNVKVLIEGEEEAGGESIAAYVKAHHKKLATDVALVVDTGMPAPGIPAITYGLRGILYTEIHCQGARHDLHSGEFGGVGPNPIHALAQLLVGLKGPDGRITIPQLYQHMVPMTDAERELWTRYPVDVIAIMKDEMGVDYLPGEQDHDPRERATARPTLEVHGIRGGFTAEGAKTVIPAEATAKVSLRLPPGLTPEQVFPWLQERVAELCPRGVSMAVRFIHGGDAVFVPLDNVYMRAAERALEAEWGRPPVFERSGGSIPVGALFDSELHTPVIFIGTGLPDDNIHAPNEKYSIPNFYHLIRQTVRFLDLLGSDPAILSRPGLVSASDHASAGRNGSPAPTAVAKNGKNATPVATAGKSGSAPIRPAGKATAGKATAGKATAGKATAGKDGGAARATTATAAKSARGGTTAPSKARGAAPTPTRSRGSRARPAEGVDAPGTSAPAKSSPRRKPPTPRG
jgi:acetylornithine deacetylase/succinyl-diaminopimelate desuccinylase-like protein